MLPNRIFVNFQGAALSRFLLLRFCLHKQDVPLAANEDAEQVEKVGKPWQAAVCWQERESQYRLLLHRPNDVSTL